MADVKGKTAPRATPLTPANLRAFLARHMITYSDIARRRGVTCDAVSQAMRSDQTGRPVSATLLRALWLVANELLIERESLCGSGPEAAV